MTIIRILMVACLFTGTSSLVSAFDQLPPEQLALLQDSGGWEYISMDDSQDGFPTEHTCFDGTPHPDVCSGTLTLSSSKTFVQKVFVHHQSVARNGTYQLNGNQLAFFDEFGNRDGPYTINIDPLTKMMMMEMPQVKVKLELYSEYRKELGAKKKRKASS